MTALAGEGVAPDAAHVGRVREIGPRAVSRTVLLRLARLPPEREAVARAVAVLGDGAALPAVAALAGVEEARVGAATRELARVEILRAEPPLDFAHPLVRDAVYHELSATERELQHAQAADLLRASGAPLEHVAAQLLHTSLRGERWAGELLWDAGRAAMQAGAVDSAVAYLRRAVDEHPFSGQLLFELGAAEVLTSGSAATEHLTRAYETLTDPLARAAVAGLLGRALMFMGSPEAAAVVARRAADELPESLTDLRLALEALEFMTLYFGAPGREGLSGLRALPRAPGRRRGRAHAGGPGGVGDGRKRRHRGAVRRAGPGGARRRPAAGGGPGADAVPRDSLARRRRPARSGRDLPRHGRRRAPPRLVALSRFGAAVVRLRRAAPRRSGRGRGVGACGRVPARALGPLHRGDPAQPHVQAEIMHERGRTEEALALLEWIGTDDPKGNTTFWWLATRATVLAAAGRNAEAVEAADELGSAAWRFPTPPVSGGAR